MNKELHCTSIDCTSRRSLCCDAKPKLFKGVEGTSYYKCSTCGGEFIPREHSCAIAQECNCDQYGGKTHLRVNCAGSLYDKITKNADENEKLGNELRDKQIREAYENINIHYQEAIREAQKTIDMLMNQIIENNRLTIMTPMESTFTTDMDINDIRRICLKNKFLDLREKLAELEHVRWSEWQKYLHDKTYILPDFYHKTGTTVQCDRIIRYKDFEHWERQINTPYDKLSEKEKDSDREQVDRYWPLIEEILKVLQ